jgi:hypothetical protein
MQQVRAKKLGRHSALRVSRCRSIAARRARGNSAASNLFAKSRRQNADELSHRVILVARTWAGRDQRPRQRAKRGASARASATTGDRRETEGPARSAQTGRDPGHTAARRGAHFTPLARYRRGCIIKESKNLRGNSCGAWPSIFRVPWLAQYSSDATGWPRMIPVETDTGQTQNGDYAVLDSRLMGDARIDLHIKPDGAAVRDAGPADTTSPPPDIDQPKPDAKAPDATGLDAASFDSRRHVSIPDRETPARPTRIFQGTHPSGSTHRHRHRI